MSSLRYKPRTRAPLTFQECEIIDIKTEEGLSMPVIAELIGRSRDAIRRYLDRKNYVSVRILISGVPNTCYQCAGQLTQGVNCDGYRVESCANGCDCQDYRYLEGFRQRG